jgi:hypothetical protein
MQPPKDAFWRCLSTTDFGRCGCQTVKQSQNIALTISSPPGDLRFTSTWPRPYRVAPLPNGGEQDRLITVRDIDPVREERLVPRYLSDDRFYERNPIPEVWVRVANCRELEWAR